MRKTVSILLITLFIPVVTGQSLSPTVLATAGSVFDNGSFSLSWTAGELAVATLTAGDIILTQGFQQPAGISTGINRNRPSWNIRSYPNPVTDYLTIHFELDKPIEIIIEVTDILGRKQVIRNRSMIAPGETRELDFTGLSEGIYLMQLMTPDKKTVQIFKIIKR
ncbi:MAG: T9SS type A sorting domain-containing protein [Chlorobi bacterium]|nr:T9SS type A sorting domain-containing protein [Chlorobiota bacterium]